MEKPLPKREWFDHLQTVRQYENLVWLSQVTGQVDRVLSIGCWSDEPFALLWITNASEIVVIEKNAEYISERLEDYERLGKQVSEAFIARSVKFLNTDITLPIDKLDPDYFDFAFCENVLYNFQDNPEQLEYAVSQIARALKPHGLLVAVESKYGVEINMVESIMGIMVPVPISEPTDIGFVFERIGMVKIASDYPYWTYIYRRQ